MMRRGAGLLLAATLLAVTGCGRGDDVPLTAPGQPGIWPADARWSPVPWIFADFAPRDGAWDPTTPLDTPTVVVVGAEGRVLEHGSGGWSDEGPVAAADLARVVCVGPGEFLAVGDAGTVVRRVGGAWHSEDAATSADLAHLVHEDGELWVGGPDGTLLQRGPGGWARLPSPGPLSGLARHGGELVAGRSDSDALAVWRDGSWLPLAPGPWAGHPVRGVAAGPGFLVVAADSVYAHDGERWSTAAHSAVPVDEDLRLRVHGDEVRWRTRASGGSWHQQHWVVRHFSDEGWGLPILGWSHSGAVIPLAAGRQVVVDGASRITWSAPDTPLRVDPAGNWSVYEEGAVPGEGLLLVTSSGVLGVDGRTVRVLAGTEVYTALGTSYAFPVGDAFEDFFLVARSAAAHCRGGTVTVTPYPDEINRPDTAAVDGEGRLHVADDHGVWRLAGGAWTRILPVDGFAGLYCDVWPVGDGRLAATVSDEMWLIDGAHRLSLGRLDSSERPVVGADGVPFLLKGVASGEWGPEANSLHVWDERRGALREVGTQGMGLLATADLSRVHADPRGPLFQTRSPTLVFTLVGSPLGADWRLLAGPGPVPIEALVRLADGALLALDNSGRGLHLYRP